MEAGEYGPVGDVKMTVTERVATSMTLMMYARIAMIVLGIMSPPILGIGAWMANRLVTTMDKIADKQEQSSRDFAQLQNQVVNIVSDQVKASKNIADRIEQGERVLNDRINAQGDWARQISIRIEELSKYVYQKVR